MSGHGNQDSNYLRHHTAMARASDPQTSHDAAKAVNVTYLEGKVYAAIKAHGPRGATQDDLVASLGIPSNSITPRFKPLLDKGVVLQAVYNRKGSSGKAQRVLVAVPGVEVIAAVSASSITQAVEAERERSRASEKISELIAGACSSVAAAEVLAKNHNLSFSLDIGGYGMGGEFTDGGWWPSSQSC